MSEPMNLIPDSVDLTRPAHVPWSKDAEQSTIGGLLLDNAVFDDVRATVEPKHFFVQAHRTIFEAVEALVVACKPADVLTVAEHLNAHGQLDECGGLIHLNNLAQSVPSARNARHYAQIVRDLALRRTLMQAASEAADIACSTGSADAALDRIATIFSTVERAGARPEPRHIGQALAARCDHWSDLASGDVKSGTPTKLPTLDKALGGGIKPGKVMVLAARPSIGKTSLAQQIALSVAEQGFGVLLLSQEMTEGELVDRIAANVAQVNLGAIIEGRLKDSDWGSLSEAVDKARGLPVFLDDQPSLSLLDIRAKVRQTIKLHPLALVVVDYLQLCAAPVGKESRHHQVEALSRGLKAMAKELNVGVLLLSQINRASTQRDEPSLSDLKESGAIEEDADVVIFLQPKGNLPDGSQLLAAILAKNRQGKRGRVALSFQGATQRWVESTASVTPRATPSEPWSQ